MSHYDELQAIQEPEYTRAKELADLRRRLAEAERERDKWKASSVEAHYDLIEAVQAMNAAHEREKGLREIAVGALKELSNRGVIFAMAEARRIELEGIALAACEREEETESR
jgi:hypothetical protein